MIRLKITFASAGLLRAMRYRNYRLFFAGQCISLLGTWIQQLAVSWLAYRLTKSAFLLGVVGFSGQVPALLFTPFAGVWADRLNKHRVVIATQILSMVQALILAGLVLSGAITLAWLIMLSFFLGVINSFDIPTRQSFIIQLVDNREDLNNAIALNSSMFNMARMVGPSLAGIFVALVGEGICFLINGLSYLAVIAGLFAMRFPARPALPKKTGMFAELADGFGYAFSFMPIRTVLLLVSLISLMGGSYVVVMPVYVQQILNGDARTLGFLMGSVGLGALTGALFLAARRSPVGLEKIIGLAAGILGLGLLGFSFAWELAAALPLIFMIGLGITVHMASCNTLLQTVVNEARRGRVMSIYTMGFMGMGTFGSLLLGSLAQRFGVMNALRLGGLVCLAGALLYLSRLGRFWQEVRPVYQRRGLLAETSPETEEPLERMAAATPDFTDNPGS